MTEEYIMMQDIIQEHKERIQNIKKYYPYFKLADNSLLQWKEGKYSCLDMGYITMAVLRFFIDENNLKDKDVTYQEYENFLHTILVRDFQLKVSEGEEKELCAYLFDKLLNEGKPFSFDYFDPKDHQKKAIHMKLIESRIVDSVLFYRITSDAIEFYLDTKEIKEESSISVEQLLLSKLIDTQNFKGGIEVVKRINREVSKLKLRRNEVLALLSADVFEGKKVYEAYVNDITKWFDEEQRLFKKNSELIEKALEKAELDKKGKENARFYAMMDEIYTLELEIKKAMYKHSELLSLCTSLQLQADEIVKKSKLSTLRNSFDFNHAMNKMMENDNVQAMEAMILPLFRLNLKKQFSFAQTENLIHMKAENQEETEIITEGEEAAYVYEDELEEQRISDNFDRIVGILFEKLQREQTFSLHQFNEELTEKLGERVLKNADYYTFLVHMCQKDTYSVREIRQKPDTFFEEIVHEILERKSDYDELCFRLLRKGEETVKITEMLEISDIQFEKVDESWKKEI